MTWAKKVAWILTRPRPVYVPRGIAYIDGLLPERLLQQEAYDLSLILIALVAYAAGCLVPYVSIFGFNPTDHMLTTSALSQLTQHVSA